MKITMQHVSAVRGFSTKPGFCRRGVRLWCAQHNLSYHDLRHGGLDAEVLLATGDALARAVVEQARGKQ